MKTIIPSVDKSLLSDELKIKKVFFVHNSLEKFILIDKELLSDQFDVHDYYLSKYSDIKLFHLWKMVREEDSIFCWFASWHSLFPILFAKLQNKRSILVIGGYDIANLPEIGYGNQRGGLKKWISRCAIKNATTLVTNSYYSQAEVEKNVGVSKEQVKVVYHGIVDPFRKIFSEKENLVLTVGNVDTPNLFRKGLEPFVRAATLLPDTNFVLVGSWKDDAIDYLRSIATPNVLFTGRISDEELQDYYRRASIYVQVSQHEGFGMSLAEAMLAGCIPVVTRAGSLLEVVGDIGIYVDNCEAASVVKAIHLALDASEKRRESARQRILTLFPLEERGKKLAEIVKNSERGK
jgi:glycosyltransferase involved in cell wall biosynthesis